MADERADNAWALSTIDGLAAVGDDDARDALVECLDCDAEVATAAALALGFVGGDVAVAALWTAAGSVAAEVRAAAAIALHRAGAADPARWAAWLEREPDDSVAALVADVLGRAAAGTVSGEALAVLTTRTRPPAPPWLRAIAGWAASMHGKDVGLAAALRVLDEPVAAAILATCVAGRGGPLVPLFDGVEVDLALDVTGPLLGGTGG